MEKWLDAVELDLLTQLLGELMSAISEDCYRADWIEGTEFIVPALCIQALKLNRPQPWAQGELGPGMASVLQRIAERLGHWANLEDDKNHYVAFDPFPIPPKYLAEVENWTT